MATGIVSVACTCSGCARSRRLFWLNVALYVVLWRSDLLRLVRHRGRVLADLSDHGRGVGFFTMVAGTCVLGTQFCSSRRDAASRLGLWVLGIVLWAVL